MDNYLQLFERKKSSTKFKEGLIHEIIKLYTADQKVRIGGEVITAVNEIALRFVDEILWRTINQAHNEGVKDVNLDHIEKIIPQLLLDFA
ncbi:centromere protein X [Daphnia magna]|uniref:Centromere protein X n=2 Tax=Daphnia magna TaxID=35525 RepID=A0A164GDW8_9CRUS|nr:centromere protein X [Daphnia magna]KAK4021203.1 hypothetical protein OUZ56_003122 [Daphnia magna]KZR98845.1 Centromere protein X [Daphnia magna]